MATTEGVTTPKQAMERRFAIVAPIVLTSIGVGWLLTAQNVIPGVQWAWILLLATLGVVTLAVNGIDKFSVVSGPVLIIASCLSFLRQNGLMAIDTEIPALTIAIGSLWTVSCLLPLPRPDWILPEPDDVPAEPIRTSTLQRS
jgi:hypothetical protein